MQTFVRANENQRRLIHDFYNHAICVTQLINAGNYVKAKEYLSTLTKDAQESMFRFKTQNMVADAVLNHKYLLAESKGIFFQVDASDLSELPIADEDLVAILSNTLDNAIEATEKVESNRIIRIKLIRDTHEFLFSVKNPVNKDVSIVENSIPTSKHPQADVHGVGLLSVKNALDKYDTTYALLCENKEFLFSAIILMTP